MSVFGAKVAIIYVVVGLILAVVGGSMISAFGMEKYVEDFIKSAPNIDTDSPTLTRRDRITFAYTQTLDTAKSVFWYVIIGVGIGAIIHNYIPETLIQQVLGSQNPFSVLLATLVGIPMYADIFGTIPIAEALFFKGVGVGTILAFMMSVTALSMPSIILLRRAVKPKLLATFIAVVTGGILIIGYFFNAIPIL